MSQLRGFGGGLPNVAYIEILGGQNGDTWWNLNEITIATASSAAMPFQITWLNSVTGINATYTNIFTNQVQTNSFTNTDIGGATPPISYLMDGSSTTGIGVNGTGFAGITTSRIRLARPDTLLSLTLVNCIDLFSYRMWNCRVTVYSLQNTILDQFTLPSTIWVRNAAGFWSYTKSYATPTAGYPLLQMRMSNLVPVRQTTAFYGTGTIQTFAAPAGVYSIRFFLWGAGGVGQGNNFNSPAVGGGAYVEGNLSTSPGTPYYIIVGRPEQSGLANGGGTTLGEGGGGFSGIFSGSPAASNVIAIAGGGGGSGYNANGYGGGGGYPNGSAGVSSGVGIQGGGGTQTAGGSSSATAGSQLAGGNGGGGDNGGGGGGGGWYGGGGGTNQGGGGGGSSTYISSVFNPVTANGGNGGPTQVTPTPAGGEFSPFWISPYGRGGKDGLVVIGYTPIPNLTPVVFTYTGADQTYVVPSNVTGIQTYIWGAGAGGGGAGAFANGMIRVTPGSTLTIMVGEAGFYGRTTRTYGGGGSGGDNAGAGGGRSAIMVGSTDLVILGGGGGQGYQFNVGGAATFSGTANSGQAASGGPAATGGSQTAGGSLNGTLYQGGDGGGYSGGGGGGYYGGGAGTYIPGSGGGAGGGGSSYTTGPDYTLIEGQNSPNGTSAPGSSYPGWRNNAGAAGANGLVILIPSPTTMPNPIAYQTTSYTGPFRASTSFSGTGSVQTFTVPAGVSLIRMFCWGAGGIGQNGGNVGFAGAGGYVAGTYRVVPGQLFYVVVGRPGQTGVANGGGSTGGTGANGGGFSGVFRGNPPTANNVILIAGGGGGSGFNGNGNGGGGGYPNGNSGVAAGIGQQGGGGTQIGGGTSTANAGTQLAGGSSGNGGGGGGGWYGGGGGNNQGGGGGGSSYLAPFIQGTEFATGGNGGTNGGNPIPAANETSPYWQSPFGRSGQNGLVVIAY